MTTTGTESTVDRFGPALKAEPGDIAQRSAEETSAGTRTDVSGWFYLPEWRKTLPPQPRIPAVMSEPETWLVFVDEHGVVDGVASRLERTGRRVIRVRTGKRFREDQPGHFRIDPSVADGYQLLIGALASEGVFPTHLIHGWGVGRTASRNPSDERLLELGFYSLLHILQGLASQSPAAPLSLAVVTNHLHQVTGSEVTHPAKAAMIGLCRVAVQEIPRLRFRAVDIEWPGTRRGKRLDVVERLEDELVANSPDEIVAFRGTSRWVLGLTPIRLGAGVFEGTGLREHGSYLITGDLGRVGYPLAAFLARACRAKLSVVSRASFPPPEERGRWLAEHDASDETSVLIRQIGELELGGAGVLVLEGDVADVTRMKEVVDEIESYFGALHGVIHLPPPGMSATGSALTQLSAEECESGLQRTLSAIDALSSALSGKHLDFCLLLSSLRNVVGTPQHAAQTAAGWLEGSLAQREARRSLTPWLRVACDRWLQSEIRGPDAKLEAASQDELIEVFLRVLMLRRVSDIVVSAGSLKA